MLFMVIEHFRDRNAKPVYRRLRDEGRMLPRGLTFVDSWVTADFARCFQIMECDDTSLIEEWGTRWADLVEFEVVPILAGEDAAEAISEDLS